MSKYYPDITRAQSASLAKLRTSIPDVTRGFSALAQAATREGVLDKKTKELIVLGMSIAARCDPCIGYHVETLVKLGATRAEIEETLGLAVYMGGGPSMMYAALALEAWDQYAEVHAGQYQQLAA